MTAINAMVVDLSHWDPADDYGAVADDGMMAVIYKATQGQSYTDDTYVSQQHAAKAAGLRWGAYHFADNSDVDGQVANFLRFASPDPDELFALDWEDYGDSTMSAAQARQWIEKVEAALNRPGECVIYGGNTIKEALGDTADPFFGARRLWLCQYGSTPVVQASWETYWLWQFTDGVYGPSPHSVDGVGPCDINSYAGTADQLVAEWASGKPQPPQPSPPLQAAVQIVIVAPPGVEVKVRQASLAPPPSRVSRENEGT